MPHKAQNKKGGYIMPLIGGIYSGINYYAADLNNAASVAEMDAFLQDFVDRNTTESVVSIFLMPSRFYSASTTTANVVISQPTSIDGYIPKNKKLFTYPYCFLRVDNCTSSQDYRFEYSSDEEGRSIIFQIMCSLTASPEVICSPVGYNGFSTPNTSESISMNGFPQCAFSIDSYRAWVAQNGGASNMILQATTKVLSATAFGAAHGGLWGGIAAGASAGATELFNKAGQILVEGQKEGRILSSSGNPGFIANGLLDFYFKRMSVTSENAKAIDDFFSMYGYQVNEIGTPVLNTRPHYTYVKTTDASITGNCDVRAISKIKSIFNNGVRFWKNGDEIGNFSLDNSPDIA